MADEGTTNVGTITGKLKLDSSAWNAELDRAEAKARSLSDVDPQVSVTARVAEALANLDRVEAEAATVGRLSPTVTVKTQTVGEMWAGVESSLSASLDQRVADANARLDLLAPAARTAETAIVDVAQAAEEAAGPLSEAAGETGNLGESSLNLGKVAMPAAVVGIAALVSIMGPLTAAAVGLGGSLTGMGGAGVLAVLGIKKEMEDGTEAGQRYKTLLGSLGVDLHDLEQTAASGLLSGFTDDVRFLEQNMPALNSEVSDFTQGLSSAGGDVLKGLIAGLVQAKPLLDSGQAVIDRWASGFQEWMSGDGFKQFVDYAETELPLVTQNIEDLGSAVVSVTTAGSDTGNGVLAILDGISKAVTFTADTYTKSRDFLQGNFLGGVVNSALEALNPLYSGQQAVEGLGKAFSSSKKDQDAAKTSVQQYSGALRQYTPDVSALSDEFGDLSKKESLAKQSASELSQALQDLDNGTISASRAETNFNQAVADAADGLKQHGRGLDENTQKGRDNQNALDQIAASALALVSAQHDAGESQKTLDATMQTGHDKFVAAATAAGMGAQAAEDLAKKYGLVPGNVDTTIQAHGISDVQIQIDKLNAEIAILEGAHDVTFNDPTVGRTRNGTQDKVARADGGTIFAASGATVPGAGTYRDGVRAVLAPGEEITSNRSGQADKYRPVLRSINANSSPEAVLAQVAAMIAPQQQQSPRGGVSIVQNIQGTSMTPQTAMTLAQHKLGSVMKAVGM